MADTTAVLLAQWQAERESAGKMSQASLLQCPSFGGHFELDSKMKLHPHPGRLSAIGVDPCSVVTSDLQQLEEGPSQVQTTAVRSVVAMNSSHSAAGPLCTNSPCKPIPLQTLRTADKAAVDRGRDGAGQEKHR